MSIASKLNITRRVSVISNLTAHDWQLYTVTKDCADAARALNVALQVAVNSGNSRGATTHIVHNEMRRLARYGAFDSEPIRVLEKCLDEIFGEHS